MTGLPRQDRILTAKLELLFRGHIAIPGNMAVAGAVAFFLRSTFPAWFLVSWLCITVLVGLSRLYLHHRFERLCTTARCTRCWANAFTLGSLASGVLWGVLCSMLIFWGTTNDYVVLTFVTAGMTAGSLATFSPYMPAYFAYAVPFTGTMALASFFSHDDVIPGNAPLILFYFAVITLTCRHFNRFVSHTVELKVDNEILKESLTTTRQERDRARTEKWSTLAQLSHELRTPLNAIMGFSEAMRDEVLGALGNRRYKDYAGHIHTSGHHLLTVADELLLLSQGESGMLVLKETPVDFGGLIASLVTQRREMALNTGLQLTVRIAPDLPRLKADSVMLHHMLGNLLDNAFKFTPAGGAVQLTAAVNDDGCLAVSIEDSGIGMEAADIPRALRPFGRISSPLTANTCGAGLGLPICQRLADAHGANLAIASTPGTGTRVTVTFPAERVLAAENPAESDTCKGEAAA